MEHLPFPLRNELLANPMWVFPRPHHYASFGNTEGRHGAFTHSHFTVEIPL